ncbi:MAG: hypothetical protein AAFQ09_01330 [Pseudomonadota bacterium]
MPVLFASAVLAVAYFAFMILIGLPDGHSARFNYAWLVGYSEAFQSGTLLPRFLPTLNGGMGGFDFFFYGPLPFWLTAAVAAPLCPSCAAETPFIAVLAALSILGSFGVYLLCRRFFGQGPSLAGAVIYALLPYHLWVDWFFRQATTEFAAYAFLPFVALGMDKARSGQNGGALIVFGVAGTALCHLPTALLAAHVFGMIALAMVFHRATPAGQRLTLLGGIVGWTVLGIGLAAFYWLPALALLPTVSPDALYETHYTAAHWLFGPQSNWWRGSVDHPLDTQAVLYNGLAILFGTLICVIAVLRTGGMARILILIPVAVALFMNSALSAVFWEYWIIDKVQFPWRLLVFLDLSAALGGAAIVAAIAKKTLRPLAVIPLLCCAAVTFVLIGQSFVAGDLPGRTDSYYAGYAPSEYLSPERFAATNDARKIIRAGVDINDIIDLAFRDFAKAHAVARDGTYSGYVAQNRIIQLRPNPAAERVLAPVQYWFLWMAETEDGTPLNLVASSDFGTVDILAPRSGFEDSVITLQLQHHWSELVGVVLSAISLLAFALVTAARRRRVKTSHAAG